MKRRIAKKEGGDARHLAPIETEVFRELLPLVEHMCIRKYDDGEMRAVGWITIKTEGHAWVVQVKDPDGACQIKVIGETLDAALRTAAVMLAADDCPWEPDGWLSANKAKKKSSK